MTVQAIYFRLLFIFFVVDINVILLDMNDGLSKKRKRFTDESRRDLWSFELIRLPKLHELRRTSFMQLARAMASLRRIMLSS